MLIKLSKFIDDDHLVRAASKNGMGRYEGRQACQYRKLCLDSLSWVGLVETGWEVEDGTLRKHEPVNKTSLHMQ